MNSENDENALSIPKAAEQLGLDSFSLYELIQRDEVRPHRQRWGELVILQIELDKVLEKPAKPSNGENNGR